MPFDRLVQGFLLDQKYVAVELLDLYFFNFI